MASSCSISPSPSSSSARLTTLPSTPPSAVPTPGTIEPTIGATIGRAVLMMPFNGPATLPIADPTDLMPFIAPLNRLPRNCSISASLEMPVSSRASSSSSASLSGDSESESSPPKSIILPRRPRYPRRPQRPRPPRPRHLRQPQPRPCMNSASHSISISGVMPEVPVVGALRQSSGIGLPPGSLKPAPPSLRPSVSTAHCPTLRQTSGPGSFSRDALDWRCATTWVRPILLTR